MIDNYCTFCAIANKEIKARIIAENDSVLAFYDIKPAAPFHALIIPKAHIEGINEIRSKHANVMGDMLKIIQELMCFFHVEETGHRLVVNAGLDAGQSIFHLHVHFLAGMKFLWPPG